MQQILSATSANVFVHNASISNANRSLSAEFLWQKFIEYGLYTIME